MKKLAQWMAALLIFGSVVFAEEKAEKPETQSEEVIRLSKQFWEAITNQKVEEAKKCIFVASDDPKLEQGKMIAEMVSEEFSHTLSHVKGKEAQFKYKDVTVEGSAERMERPVVAITMLVWEPDEEEFEELSITWLKTEKAGWKLVDL